MKTELQDGQVQDECGRVVSRFEINMEYLEYGKRSGKRREENERPVRRRMKGGLSTWRLWSAWNGGG